MNGRPKAIKFASPSGSAWVATEIVIVARNIAAIERAAQLQEAQVVRNRAQAGGFALNTVKIEEAE
jgi:hypothetical protein